MSIDRNDATAFVPADILLPAAGTDMQKWAVVACDQFSSQPEYWEELSAYVGGAPSALRMMLPEAYLGAPVKEAVITVPAYFTDSQRQANLETLTAQRGTVYKMSEFKSNSDLYLYEQYIKLLPILIGVFVIVLAELICSVALHTKKQMRNYGIYFLCGCRWRDCLKISIAYSALLLAASAVIGTAAFLIFQTTSYARMFEQNLGVNNITITLGLVAAMLAVSLVIPFFMVRRTSPTELIKEN